jgi:hypothetical protein
MGWQSMKCAGAYADILAGDGWQLYETSYCRAEAVPGVAAAVTEAAARHRVMR